MLIFRSKLRVPMRFAHRHAQYSALDALTVSCCLKPVPSSLMGMIESQLINQSLNHIQALLPELRIARIKAKIAQQLLIILAAASAQ